MTHAQNTLPCTSRPTAYFDGPRIITQYWCMELIVEAADAGELAFTALAIDAENTLYATRPLQGEVWRLRDSTGNGLQNEATLLIAGLRLPNALAVADDALYIGGDGIIYRWQNETLTVLVDDLPAGRGFFPAGLLVHDAHLYVGIPAPCDFCEPDDPRQGTVMRFELDGTNPEIIARGLRYPAGLAVRDNRLWITDTARDGLSDTTFFDELNAVDLDSDEAAHFGWPYCIGADNQPDLRGDFDCGSATPPIMLFQSQSTPLALHTYQAPLFRNLQNDLLVVLSGSSDHSIIRGYQLISIDFADDGHMSIDSIVPNFDQQRKGQLVPYQLPGYNGDISRRLNRQGDGVWPHALYGMAVNEAGWIYFSLGGGIIAAITQGDQDPCTFLDC